MAADIIARKDEGGSMTNLSRSNGIVSAKPPRIETFDFGPNGAFSKSILARIAEQDFVDVPLRSPTTVASPPPTRSRIFSWRPGPDAADVAHRRDKTQKSALQFLKRSTQEQPYFFVGSAIGLPAFLAGIGVGLASNLPEKERDIAILIGFVIAVSLMTGGNAIDKYRKRRPAGESDIELQSLTANAAT